MPKLAPSGALGQRWLKGRTRTGMLRRRRRPVVPSGAGAPSGCGPRSLRWAARMSGWRRRWRRATADRHGSSSPDEVVRVVRVVEHEPAEGTELALDRVGPRAIGGGEAPLDGVPGTPAVDLLALVGREVVQGSQRSVAPRGVGDGSFRWRPECWRPTSADTRCRKARRRRPGSSRETGVAPPSCGRWPADVGVRALRPVRSADRLEPRGPNSFEDEDPVGVLGEDLVDAVELLVTSWVVRLLPSWSAGT